MNRFAYTARQPLSIALTAVGLLCPMIGAQQTSGVQPIQEKYQRSFTVQSGSTLLVDNHKGTIHVTGGSGNQVVVSVYKHFEGTDKDRSWWMYKTDISFQNDDGRVSVEVHYPNWNCPDDCYTEHDNYTGEVELKIQVPRQVNVHLTGHHPSMKVSGIEGELRISGHRPEIDIESVTGAIQIDTYRGTLNAKDLNVRGRLDVKEAKGEALIEARSLGDEVTLETAKGSIRLRVPENAGLTIDYEGSRRADFHSDFPIASQSDLSGQTVHGTINGGGAKLHLRSERGSIRLEKL